MELYIPENYDPVLTVRETQEAIKFIRDLFQKEFGRQMNLERISAPLFVAAVFAVSLGVSALFSLIPAVKKYVV